ncbi:NAD(P)-dependent oxidoreductase [Saccharopolyspora antimicrobica]|uniref:3-hydroxyisobutyrate dehydrogenase-like beta-hydroxyacid dehydrogenase n=2 Tax=Saccharopolyspora antimicrobica TaxID=455193 RepID=A0ABX9TE40_9PSEU|nr:NAD(P)-binding domain-containing protein [Saccharopolyspora antimicrobica]RKT85226.1 3-hydroxyisobutyrate dehydrogenase-like beta-hydroxyacid dehydrogenase [Saccharopolyspora antimicrobica]
MTNQREAVPQQAPVTVVGLGPMGLALAEALLHRGHSTTVWNRTPAKADGVVAGGARRAASIAEAVSASEIVIICLKDYETMYGVLGPAAEALRGRTLVNLNSGTPSEAAAAADWAAEIGAAYLDGAIMVPPPLVGDPESVFLYSGSEDVFDEHRETLASMGAPRFLGADPGLAVLHNTALLGLMYATMNGFLHATALVGSAGVSAVEFADLAVNWFMPAVVVNPTLVEQAADLDASNYPGDVGTMEMNRNALEHIARTCVEQGVHADQARHMAAIAEQAIAAGHGGENYLAVFEVFKSDQAMPQRRIASRA